MTIEGGGQGDGLSKRLLTVVSFALGGRQHQCLGEEDSSYGIGCWTREEQDEQ